MKSYDHIPEGYQLTYDLHLLKNTKVFALLNILQVVLILPFIPGFLFLNWLDLFSYERIVSGVILLLIPAMVVMIVIHELIHGFFFKKFSGKRVKYQFHGWAASASTPGIYYRKKYYLIIGLAPAVILNTLFLIGTFLLPKPLNTISYFLLAIHVSSCVGDFYVSWILRKYPEDAYIEDTGVGLKIYEYHEADIQFE